jgi:hypothetical protein
MLIKKDISSRVIEKGDIDMKISGTKFFIVPWIRNKIAVILSLLIVIYVTPNYCQIVNGSFETDTGQFSITGWRNWGGEPCNDVPPGGGNWSLGLRSGCVWVSCSQYIPEARNGDIYKIECWVKIIPPYGGGSISWSNNQWIENIITDTVWTYLNLIDTLEVTNRQDSIYFILEGGGGIAGMGGACYDLVKLTKLGNITLISNKHPFSEEFILHQNYPNPFNPLTTIKFDLPKVSKLTLKIFNILGEEVTILVSESISTGSYSYEWDASNLPSGVYLYRLEAEEFVETKKMILMR